VLLKEEQRALNCTPLSNTKSKYKKKGLFSGFISYFSRKSGTFRAYRQHSVQFSTAACVPSCVMWTTRTRVIWLSGPSYTTPYKVRHSTDDNDRIKKISKRTYGKYRKVNTLTALETVKNEAVVNVVRIFNIQNTAIKGRVSENLSLITSIGHPKDSPEETENYLFQRLLRLEEIF
jgi:hypothetical protein